jgi:hypothetical protein
MTRLATLSSLPPVQNMGANSNLQPNSFVKTLAFQPFEAPPAPVAKAPIIRPLILEGGKSVEVKFTRKGANIQMRTIKGAFLGEGPAKQLLPMIEASAKQGIMLKTIQSLGMRILPVAVFVTVLFGKTQGLNNNEPDVRAQNFQYDGLLKSALELAGINLSNNPKGLTQFKQKLGKKLKAFVARANQLNLQVEQGKIKRDNATAILLAELDVKFLKQGNDTNTDVRLPQAPSSPPNINEPKRKFTLNPVPDVPALSGIVAKPKPVQKVASLPAPHDRNIDEQIKELAKTHQRDVFQLENIDDIAKTYGVSRDVILANNNNGESLQQTAARIAGARFAGATGAADGATTSLQSTIGQRVKAINNADPRVVAAWWLTMPESERLVEPDPIKKAVEIKLSQKPNHVVMRDVAQAIIDKDKLRLHNEMLNKEFPELIQAMAKEKGVTLDNALHLLKYSDPAVAARDLGLNPQQAKELVKACNKMDYTTRQKIIKLIRHHVSFLYHAREIALISNSEKLNLDDAHEAYENTHPYWVGEKIGLTDDQKYELSNMLSRKSFPARKDIIDFVKAHVDIFYYIKEIVSHAKFSKTSLEAAFIELKASFPEIMAKKLNLNDFETKKLILLCRGESSLSREEIIKLIQQHGDLIYYFEELKQYRKDNQTTLSEAFEKLRDTIPEIVLKGLRFSKDKADELISECEDQPAKIRRGIIAFSKTHPDMIKYAQEVAKFALESNISVEEAYKVIINSTPETASKKLRLTTAQSVELANQCSGQIGSVRDNIISYVLRNVGSLEHARETCLYASRHGVSLAQAYISIQSHNTEKAELRELLKEGDFINLERTLEAETSSMRTRIIAFTRANCLDKYGNKLPGVLQTNTKTSNMSNLYTAKIRSNTSYRNLNEFLNANGFP